MSNRDKYIAAFKETFMIEEKDLANLKYQGVKTWDSVGHMQLMTALEEAFGVELDIDDIIEFSSFDVGQKILEKYIVVME